MSSLCEVCKRPIERADEYSVGCSEFCLVTSKEVKEASLQLKPGDFGIYPCSECGCAVEDVYDEESCCASCAPTVTLRTRTKLLSEAAVYAPADLQERIRKAAPDIKIEYSEGAVAAWCTLEGIRKVLDSMGKRHGMYAWGREAFILQVAVYLGILGVRALDFFELISEGKNTLPTEGPLDEAFAKSTIAAAESILPLSKKMMEGYDDAMDGASLRLFGPDNLPHLRRTRVESGTTLDTFLAWPADCISEVSGPPNALAAVALAPEAQTLIFDALGTLSSTKKNLQIVQVESPLEALDKVALERQENAYDLFILHGYTWGERLQDKIEGLRTKHKRPMAVLFLNPGTTIPKALKFYSILRIVIQHKGSGFEATCIKTNLDAQQGHRISFAVRSIGKEGDS